MFHARDVTARGVRIRLVEAGEGPAIVLVHGFLGRHADWSSVMGPLAAEGYRVVAPDLPGFGDSEKPDPERYAYGYRAFAESIADVVAALGLGRVGVCGHAMGAGVALTLASSSPALVKGLVLSCPAIHGDEGWLGRLAAVPGLGGLVWRQMLGAAALRRYLLATKYAGSPRVDDERLRATAEALWEPAARHAAHATLAATADRRALIAMLPRVKTDAVVVWGQEDARPLAEHGRRLARALGARLETVPGGRAVPQDAPDALADIAARFFADAPAPTSKRGRASASSP
ncbi:MAG: alpha/beta hydrolase [Myxococcales bacterium]|nr:alpha/beta hydrolase [Myxococcales bacterium]